ncbi:SGNH/GDSL hydrolase family protein [Desulfosporosinus sp. PR]|uniref:SGNH/GDSL hydrolase family protein n=1 Tax=Candidatus Desulfosporosinus nitrosoreducens TaxID=3401928 RepID=UPI0027F46087|nr:SGNH/GDSL hydrolase family protein [Desulfosporosinus sp. PR]MDQ7097042.1 SGNH/GDSL hydrolase family protein [Desulfosporosinus sp. PR]
MSLYLALGDSITAGYGVGMSFSFPTLYAQYLRRYEPDLQLLNLGVNGLTTRGLLASLRQNPGLRQRVCQASLITLTIGSNDLLQYLRNSSQVFNLSQLTLALNCLGKTLCLIGEELRCLNPRATLKIGTLYNPLPAGPYAQYARQAQPILDRANSLILAWANCYGGNVAQIEREFCGKEQLLIGPDFAHPNAEGYQRIARAFARA